MASKNNIEVIIDGKIYTLSGYESEEYLQKVGAYINNMLYEFRKEDSFKKFSPDVQRTLLNINIADEYFKAKKQAENLEHELEAKDKELYEVKHELIASQIKVESGDTELEEMKKQIADLQKEIVRLETKIIDMKEHEANSSKKNNR